MIYIYIYIYIYICIYIYIDEIEQISIIPEEINQSQSRFVSRQI